MTVNGLRFRQSKITDYIPETPTGSENDQLNVISDLFRKMSLSRKMSINGKKGTSKKNESLKTPKAFNQRRLGALHPNTSTLVIKTNGIFKRRVPLH